VQLRKGFQRHASVFSSARPGRGRQSAGRTSFTKARSSTGATREGSNRSSQPHDTAGKSTRQDRFYRIVKIFCRSGVSAETAGFCLLRNRRTYVWRLCPKKVSGTLWIVYAAGPCGPSGQGVPALAMAAMLRAANDFPLSGGPSMRLSLFMGMRPGQSHSRPKSTSPSSSSPEFGLSKRGPREVSTRNPRSLGSRGSW